MLYLCAFLPLLLVGCDQNRQDSYEKGRSAGYQEGYKVGSDNGHKKGYNEGHADGKAGKPNHLKDTRQNWERLGVVTIVMLVFLDVMWLVFLFLYFWAMSEELKAYNLITQIPLLFVPIGLAGLAYYVIVVIGGFRIIDALSLASINFSFSVVISIILAVALYFIIWLLYIYKKKIDVYGYVISLGLLVLITMISIQLTFNAFELAGGKLHAKSFSLMIASACIGCLLAILKIGLEDYKKRKKVSIK